MKTEARCNRQNIHSAVAEVPYDFDADRVVKCQSSKYHAISFRAVFIGAI